MLIGGTDLQRDILGVGSHHGGTAACSTYPATTSSGNFATALSNYRNYIDR